MRIETIAFQGYKAFAGPAASGLEPAAGGDQVLVLHPLTLVFGKNNSGKSTVVRLPRLILGGLSCDAPQVVLPLEVRGLSYGHGFFDLTCGGAFYGRPRFALRAEHDGKSLDMAATLHAQGAFSADDPPHMWSYEMREPETFRFAKPREVQGSGLRFDGLLPADARWNPWRHAANQLLDEMIHLGPARAPVRHHYSNQPPSRLGIDGAQAVQWLRTEAGLAKAVSDWYRQHMDGWRLYVQRDPDSFSLQIRRSDQLSANLAQSGAGLQHVLPVVVHQFMRQQMESSWFLDVIEQPELHLHAAAQAPLADLFIETARERRGVVLVESHSRAILLRVQRRVAEGRIAPSDVAIYFVEMAEHGSALRRIEIDERGELGGWPEGVFEEDFREVAAIRRAQRRRGTERGDQG